MKFIGSRLGLLLRRFIWLNALWLAGVLVCGVLLPALAGLLVDDQKPRPRSQTTTTSIEPVPYPVATCVLIWPYVTALRVADLKCFGPAGQEAEPLPAEVIPPLVALDLLLWGYGELVDRLAAQRRRKREEAARQQRAILEAEEKACRQARLLEEEKQRQEAPRVAAAEQRRQQLENLPLPQVIVTQQAAHPFKSSKAAKPARSQPHRLQPRPRQDSSRKPLDEGEL